DKKNGASAHVNLLWGSLQGVSGAHAGVVGTHGLVRWSFARHRTHLRDVLSHEAYPPFGNPPDLTRCERPALTPAGGGRRSPLAGSASEVGGRFSQTDRLPAHPSYSTSCDLRIGLWSRRRERRARPRSLSVSCNCDTRPG